MTYKNIFLNFLLINVFFICSANAEWLSGEKNIGADEEFLIPVDGMNLTKLTMTDTSSLIWKDEDNNYGYNNNYIEDATFSGTFDMGVNTENDNFVHALNVSKATFNNIDVIGHYNPTKSFVTWGDLSSFWSNQLVLTGNITMDTVQVGMESDSVKGVDFFEGATVFDFLKSDYEANKNVVWNGGLYKTRVNQGSFKDAFYADLADKVDSGALVEIDEMDQYTPVVGVGQSYKNGDVFQVVGTNQFLYSVGLIDEIPEGQDLSTRILAFMVSDDIDTLTPSAILDAEQLPISYNSGVIIQDANVTLNRTCIMSTPVIDAMQREAMGTEFAGVLGRLHELEGNMSSDDVIFIHNNLDTLYLSSGPDEFWNQLRNYTGDNEDIKQAYEDTDVIHTKYLKIASHKEALPVTIQNSVVNAGNTSIQKHDSGTFVIDNSTINLYGSPDEVMSNDYGGSISLLNHSGATGDMVIRNHSELNLYPNSNVGRRDGKGNIYVIDSTINMRGDDTTFIDEGDEDGGSSVSVTNGNFQLTENSVLNAYGSNNGFNLPEIELNFETQNWQDEIKAKSLYVNNSTINITEDSDFGIGVYYEDEEDDDDINGVIAMDVDSVINVHGILSADIVSLHTDADAGVVNLYNNAWIDGDVYRANVFVNPGAEKENVKLYGRLSLTDSALDIGTHTLNFGSFDELLTEMYGEDYMDLFDEDDGLDDLDLDTKGFLYLDNSTITTHIDLEKDTNGIINVEKLEFGDTPSTVNIVIDDGVLNPRGATFDFLTGDKDIGDNLVFNNIMYDITYNDGRLTLVPNGNSGVISLDDLNERLAATGWLSSGFADGSKAKMLADALNEWAQTDPESFKKAIKQIQPETTPTQQATSQSTNNQVVSTVETRMNESGTEQGHSGGDVFKKVAVWAQGLYNKSKLTTSNGFDGDTYGFAMGTEAEVNKNLLLGLGYAYNKSDIDTESRSTDVDSHTAILYGKYDFGGAFVSGITTYGFNRYQEESNIKTAKYNMDTIFAQAMTGYNFYIDSFSLTPETGIRYLWTNAHGYTDSAEQHISGSNTNTLTGVLGGLASVQLQSWDVVFKPSVKALAKYDMMKDADAVNVTLANGSGYVVSGSEFNRFGVEFGIGLGVNYESFDLSLNYDIEIRENYTSQTGMLKGKYNF